MHYHEREFFISCIRSGKVKISCQDIKLEVRPLTIDQSLEANFIYNEAFQTAFVDGIMTEYEIKEWMNDNGLWTIEHENKTKKLKNELETLKIEIYKRRYEKKDREQIRKYIRACEKFTADHLKEKSSYYQNTREGYALSEKMNWIIRNSTYSDNQLYDFKDISVNYVLDEWQNSILSETVIRDLAREEPWKSLWSIRQGANIRLFSNIDNMELTPNQKHLVIWSQVYDNIQESLDCPDEDFIKDDDVLDGWFLIQSQKRKAEKLERELEGEVKNEKIRNSSEVFVMAKDKDNQRRINDMNNPMAKAIIKQRQEAILSKGSLRQQDLPDEVFDLQLQRNNSKNGG